MKKIAILLLALCSCVAAQPIGISPTALTTGESLQAVIDRGGPLVYVPAGKYIADKTIYLKSNMTLFCAEGTIIEAAPGAFLEAENKPEACLLVLDQLTNVRIFNCTFAMRKLDYGTKGTPKPPYVPSEWRHAIKIIGSTGILLYNVQGYNSGGDGLYIGPSTRTGERIPSRSITVQHSLFTNNHRQGISVLTCLDECLIEDCTFSGTTGASPQAGIDIEPESGDAVDITVRRCKSIGNRGAAYIVSLTGNTPTIKPSKINFEDCIYSDVPKDQMNLLLYGVLKPSGYMMDNLPAGTMIEFNGTVWRK